MDLLDKIKEQENFLINQKLDINKQKEMLFYFNVVKIKNNCIFRCDINKPYLVDGPQKTPIIYKNNISVIVQFKKILNDSRESQSNQIGELEQKYRQIILEIEEKENILNNYERALNDLKGNIEILIKNNSVMCDYEYDNGYGNICHCNNYAIQRINGFIYGDNYHRCLMHIYDALILINKHNRCINLTL